MLCRCRLHQQLTLGTLSPDDAVSPRPYPGLRLPAHVPARILGWVLFFHGPSGKPRSERKGFGGGQATRSGLEVGISASNIATLRMQAERRTQDDKVRHTHDRLLTTFLAGLRRSEHDRLWTAFLAGLWC